VRVQSITKNHLQKYYERTAKCIFIFEGTAMKSDAFLIVYTFETHLQGKKVIFELTKVYDNSGQ